MRFFSLDNNFGLTLTELLIAVALLGFVSLAVVGIDISARKLLGATDKEGVIVREATAAMAHMEKWISLTTGDSTNLGISTIPVGGDSITFRVDYDVNGNCKNTPETYSDDTTKRYALVSNSLRFYPNYGSSPGTYKTLSTRIFDVDFARYYTTPNFGAKVKLTTRYDPTTASGFDNPQVILESRISLRAHSNN